MWAANYLVKQAAGAARLARILGAASRAKTDARRAQLAELVIRGLGPRSLHRVGSATPELGAARLRGMLEPIMRIPDMSKHLATFPVEQVKGFVGSLPRHLPTRLAPAQAAYQRSLQSRAPLQGMFQELQPVLRKTPLFDL